MGLRTAPPGVSLQAGLGPPSPSPHLVLDPCFPSVSLIVKVLGGIWALAAPATQRPLPALCGPRRAWAQARVGCCRALRLLENKSRSVGRAGGQLLGRDSVFKSPGEGSQDKYAQPRGQEGWKIPEAEASLHHCGLTTGLAGREGRCQGLGPGVIYLLPPEPCKRWFLGGRPLWGVELGRI